MADESTPEIYQLHVWIRRISPMIWRRLLVRTDSTLADLRAATHRGAQHRAAAYREAQAHGQRHHQAESPRQRHQRQPVIALDLPPNLARIACPPQQPVIPPCAA